MKFLQTIKNGLLDENPVFRLVLGMCPTLAVTTSASTALEWNRGNIRIDLFEFVYFHATECHSFQDQDPVLHCHYCSVCYGGSDGIGGVSSIFI
jgi:hypothetical protein